MIPAIALLATGAVGIIIAVVMEHRQREPKWKLMMKIMPPIFGAGIALLILALRG